MAPLLRGHTWPVAYLGTLVSPLAWASSFPWVPVGALREEGKVCQGLLLAAVPRQGLVLPPNWAVKPHPQGPLWAPPTPTLRLLGQGTPAQEARH